MDGPKLVALAAVIGIAVWFAAKPPALFVVRIRFFVFGLIVALVPNNGK